MTRAALLHPLFVFYATDSMIFDVCMSFNVEKLTLFIFAPTQPTEGTTTITTTMEATTVEETTMATTGTTGPVEAGATTALTKSLLSFT